jgi:YcaO-like protein with predicted kinase domain
MGITRLGNITGLDRIGIPVAIAVRPGSRSTSSVAHGKGLTLEQAMASALMEAAERWHGGDIEHRFRLSAYRDLAAAEHVVDPQSLPSNGSPFDETAEIHWIEGYDLLQRESCWVPAEIVHTDYTVRPGPDSGCFLRCSNGLASGNHLVEALSSAICEVVERDAAAIWSGRSIRKRALCHIDPESIDDADCRALLARYEQAGIAIRVWNVTTDVGIAAFVCDIREQSEDPRLGLRRFRGAGCHPNRAIALSRALTEAAQTRLTYIAGARDDLSPADYEPALNAEIGEALLDVLQQSGAAGSYRDAPSFDSDDLVSDVRWELDRLRSVGVERVVAIDLTQPELEIPVVRVVIPGLEGDTRNPEYCPGPRARRAGAAAKTIADRVKAEPTAATAVPAAAGMLEGRAVIFAGPSLPPSVRPTDPRLVWRPPARQGDVYRAALQRPAVIGLIDGYFDAVPSVQHKEILWAMERGILVYGAASIGALRAAELAEFGMRGVGWVYQMYRDGTLIDDDEVAVLHGPEEVGFMSVTESMVNIRATVTQKVRGGSLEPADADSLIAAVKEIFYQQRTKLAILAVVAELGPRDVARRTSVIQALEQRLEQKARDALAMVDAVRQHLALGTQPIVVDYKMANTAMWNAA